MNLSRMVTRRIRKLGKFAYQAVRIGRIEPPVIAFVVGCQRSGTSMLMDIFDLDIRALVFREEDRLFEGLRLKPLETVGRYIRECNAPLVVAKTLLDSQRTRELLENFPKSFAIWIYRHYKSVAHSNLRQFGDSNGIDDLRPIVSGSADNWRSERVSPVVREHVSTFFSESMNVHDAAALFWYARNQLLFDQALSDHPRVILCKYEDVVTTPEEEIHRIYSHLKVRYPGKRVVREVHSGSKHKGMDVGLSGPVSGICQRLWGQLEQAREQSSSLAGAS